MVRSGPGRGRVTSHEAAKPAAAVLDELAARGARWRAFQARQVDEEGTMIDERLLHRLRGIANALSPATVDAMLTDLDGWHGPNVDTMRQALQEVKDRRASSDRKPEAG